MADTEVPTRRAFLKIEKILSELGSIDALALLHDLESTMTDVMRPYAEQARAEGWTWDQIGQALDTTRQGAWNRLH